MKTRKIFSVFVSLSGALLCLAALTPYANAACGPKLPFGLSPLLNQEAAKADLGRDDTVMKPAPGSPNSGKIVGLWLVSVAIGGQPYGQAFEAFTSDGVEILNDSGPPQAGNVCLGVWAAGHSTIRVNHPSWNYDESGNVIGTVVLKSEIVLRPGANSYRGTITIQVYDVNGNAVGPAVIGELSATRITAS